MEASPPGDFGCEFYMGDADAIGLACTAGKWTDLRSGALGARFVGFPACVHSLDVLLLSQAVSEVMEQPEVALGYDREVAGDEGLWGAGVLPKQWVHSIASVPEERLPALRASWKAVHDAEYETADGDPDWLAPSVLAAVQTLRAMCHEARLHSREVVLVWAQ